MLETLIPLTIELTIGFIALLISVKVIGKRQVAQITPFDFISAIVMGELLGNALYDDEINILFVIYAITVWTLLLHLIEKITQRSIKARRLVQGTPVFVIKEGLIDYNVMKHEGLDINELLLLIREKDTFSIKHIDYALLETNGNISIIKKKGAPSEPSLHLTLIFDKVILDNNLKLINKDVKWLMNKLKDKQINDLREVLFCEWSSVDNEIYIQKVDKTD